MQTPAILSSKPASRAQLAAGQFKRWYSATGHWVYEYRADALRTWRERGINTLPAWSAEADALIAQWVAADPLPALVATWRQATGGRS